MPRWAIGIALIALIYLQARLWIGPGGVIDARELAAEVEASEAHNAELKARNNLLDAQVQSLKNDPSALEYHARRELGMIKQGETFFLVVKE